MKNLLTIVLFIGVFFTSCTIEQTQEIDLTGLGFTMVRDGEQIEVQNEAKCILEVGSQVTIVLIGDIDENTVDWESTNPDVVKVEFDKLTAIKPGEAKIIDRNNPQRVISIVVQ